MVDSGSQEGGRSTPVLISKDKVLTPKDKEREERAKGLANVFIAIADRRLGDDNPAVVEKKKKVTRKNCGLAEITGLDFARPPHIACLAAFLEELNGDNGSISATIKTEGLAGQEYGPGEQPLLENGQLPTKMISGEPIEIEDTLAENFGDGQFELSEIELTISQKGEDSQKGEESEEVTIFVYGKRHSGNPHPSSTPLRIVT